MLLLHTERWRCSVTTSVNVHASVPVACLWLSPHGQPDRETNVGFPIVCRLRCFYLTIDVPAFKLTVMTDSKAEAATKPAKELLALNPKQEGEFKKKVQEVKKKKYSKVGNFSDLKETWT